MGSDVAVAVGWPLDTAHRAPCRTWRMVVPAAGSATYQRPARSRSNGTSIAAVSPGIVVVSVAHWVRPAQSISSPSSRGPSRRTSSTRRPSTTPRPSHSSVWPQSRRTSTWIQPPCWRPSSSSSDQTMPLVPGLRLSLTRTCSPAGRDLQQQPVAEVGVLQAHVQLGLPVERLADPQRRQAGPGPITAQLALGGGLLAGLGQRPGQDPQVVEEHVIAVPPRAGRTASPVVGVDPRLAPCPEDLEAPRVVC